MKIFKFSPSTQRIECLVIHYFKTIDKYLYYDIIELQYSQFHNLVQENPVNQQVIIAGSRNFTPEEEINARVEKLGPGWKIISATTALFPFGEMRENHVDIAQHMYYVTTVVVKKD